MWLHLGVTVEAVSLACQENQLDTDSDVPLGLRHCLPVRCGILRQLHHIGVIAVLVRFTETSRRFECESL